jgi:nitrous oxidase accessory protein NosD
VLSSGVELSRPLPEGFVGRTLKVGAGEKYQNPSEAAADARPGDTVEIAAGTYVDCALWPAGASPLTIVGNGKVVLADKTCGDKGIFIVRGADVTIRGITFSGAKVRDRNGAGIRGEGLNLTVENSRFDGNENGILAGVRGGTIIIRDSYFERNGTCVRACAHGIYIGQKIEKLHIENSHFINQRVGHHIKSRALTTELINNTIEDGPDGTASFLVDLPNGGTLVMRGNTLEKGPHSQNRTTVIAIGEEGDPNPSSQILIENNKLTNDSSAETIFVRNFGMDPVTLRNNKFTGSVMPMLDMPPRK